jgi:hypothetical protein
LIVAAGGDVGVGLGVAGGVDGNVVAPGGTDGSVAAADGGVGAELGDTGGVGGPLGLESFGPTGGAGGKSCGAHHCGGEGVLAATATAAFGAEGNSGALDPPIVACGWDTRAGSANVGTFGGAGVDVSMSILANWLFGTGGKDKAPGRGSPTPALVV